MKPAQLSGVEPRSLEAGFPTVLRRPEVDLSVAENFQVGYADFKYFDSMLWQLLIYQDFYQDADHAIFLSSLESQSEPSHFAFEF